MILLYLQNTDDRARQFMLGSFSFRYLSGADPGFSLGGVGKSLKILDKIINMLNKELYFVNYPISIGQLQNLETLKMDCLRDKPLPLEYSNLRKLNILNFEGGRQNAISLGDNMSDTVTKSNISEINLAGLNIRIIGQHTFSKLGMVRKIDLSNNPELGIHLPDTAASVKKDFNKEFLI